MTLVNIKVRDGSRSWQDDDAVIFRSPYFREAEDGGLISTAEVVAELAEGQGEIELEPGPYFVNFHVEAMSDTRTKLALIPNSGPVSIFDALAHSLDWTPPLINQGLQAILDALQNALSQVADAVEDSIEDVKWLKAPLLSDAVILDLTPGLYPIPFRAAADAMELPEPGNGALIVMDNASGEARRKQYIWLPWGGSEWRRLAIGTAWDTPWHEIDGGSFTTVGQVDSGTHLDDILEVGMHQVPFTAEIPWDYAAWGYPVRLRGVLQVMQWGGPDQLVQVFISTLRGVIYTRELFAGAWGEWTEVGKELEAPPVYLRGRVPTDAHLDNVHTPGVHQVPFTAEIPWDYAAWGYPVRLRGLLHVYEWGGPDQLTQVYHSTYRGVMYSRELFSGAWGEWTEVGGSSDGNASAPMDALATNKRTKLVHSSKLRRGGVVGTDGATPIALTFDHGFANFRDYILPTLERLGLPCSIAFAPDQMDHSENEGVGYPQIQQMVLNSGVELAHHGMSHADVPDATTNIPAIERHLTESIAIAEDTMTQVKADAFIMPGVGGTLMDGFANGVADHRWWEHPAGRLILNNFPVISAKNKGQWVPMTGDLSNTLLIDRYSFGTPSGAAEFKTAVQDAHGTGMGMAVFMHPSQINTSGYVSAAQVVETLEFLAAERDAGRVEILTLSGFAYADTDRARRLDLLKLGIQSGTSWSIPFAPKISWCRGAQFVIETTATAPGPLTLSVTANAGGLDKSLTFTAVAGQKYRLAFSSPRHSTSITVSAPGADQSCQVV